MSEYLIKEFYLLCVFIRKFEYRFVIATISIDDINLIRTPDELLKIYEYFKNGNRKSNLGNKYYVGLWIEHIN